MCALAKRVPPATIEKGPSETITARIESQIAAIDAKVEDALQQYRPEATPTCPAKPDQTTIWGVPFSRLSLVDTLQHIDRLIAAGQPGYCITANLNYSMLTQRHPELGAVNEGASFIVCDGMPMVWYSRLIGQRLPERVAGSELIYAVTHWAALQGHRICFVGAAAGVAQAAAERLAERYPGLQVAGVEAPPCRPLNEQENADLVRRISAANPDIVYLAFGQPKGEMWLARHYQQIGAPMSIQLGASFDFVAGAVPRAPRWMQRAGLEWFYRLSREPQRLAGRYWENVQFLVRALLRDFSARPAP